MTERPINAANLVSRSHVTGTAATSSVIAATAQETNGGIVTKCHHIWFYFVDSDDLWRQFGITTLRDQQARLRKGVAGGLTLVTLVMVVAVLWGSGSWTPHIRWGMDDFLLTAEVDEKGVLSTRLLIEVENEGLAPFTLTGISAEIPGLRFLPADAADEESGEITVRGGGSGRLAMRLVITDCAAVPHEPQPIRFTYRTWMGSGVAEAMWDSWRLNAPNGDGIPIAWQRGVSTKICNEAVSPDWP